MFAFKLSSNVAQFEWCIGGGWNTAYTNMWLQCISLIHMSVSLIIDQLQYNTIYDHCLIRRCQFPYIRWGKWLPESLYKVTWSTAWGNQELVINILRPRKNCRHLASGIFKCIFLNENAWISLQISLKFVRKVKINNNPALVQIMAWCRTGSKALSEPLMFIFLRIYASLGGLNEAWFYIYQGVILYILIWAI